MTTNNDRSLKLLYMINVGQEYISSNSGVRFVVRGIMKHGQDCSIRMVHYENLDPTFDLDVGESWVIEEGVFMRRFSET